MSYAIFTCNSCSIQFRSSDSQRYHMKTEWHRYNLKRRIANLPPIDAAQFAEKLQVVERERSENQVDEFGFPLFKGVHRLSKEKKRDKRSEQGEGSTLATRSRRPEAHEEPLGPVRSISPTGSVASRISRLSIRSGEVTTDFGEDTMSEYGFTSESNYESDIGDDNISISSAGEQENNEVSINDCIFCGAKHKDLERNLSHMFKRHGLYIPERSYLVDLPGLIQHLIEIVVHKKQCLCCVFKGTTLESIRAHMNSKRHCKLPYETKEERNSVSQFYDFSSLDSQQTETDDMTSSKKIRFSDSKTEEDKTLPAMDSGENGINSNYSVFPVDDTGMELTLPTGARVGHRSGQRYYRQNISLPPGHSESRRTVSAADRRLASGITEKQFKQGLKNMQQMEKRALDQQIRREKSSKINYQAHYRDELLQ
ncbi:hypothetical protein HG535_0B06350 [Zygotorulaspora mrakii]|uniref:C2H2-type domain-containing protein n=1 Tax=Zygotorulaspora mrakii TaxID=42260 RepID=A0A7H9AYW1_ZYGMR|nr:uncharacterized protein HG535_0B06350 [Zygotorulaspora mrakii]QLG71590.1 hypothetical protein HG535_0B06350 [Zygotorulaspora mrakii]